MNDRTVFMLEKAIELGVENSTRVMLAMVKTMDNFMRPEKIYLPIREEEVVAENARSKKSLEESRKALWDNVREKWSAFDPSDFSGRSVRLTSVVYMSDNKNRNMYNNYDK